MHFSINYLLTTLTVVMLASFPFMGGTEILQTTPIVEALAIVLLIIFFLFQKHFDFINKTIWVFLLFAVLTPLLYLIPLSAGIWENLPGHAIYTQMAQWISTDSSSDSIYRTLSLIPYRTEHAFFAMLPPLAIFLTVAALPEQQKRFIIYFILGIATAEACLAMIQYSTNSDFFYFGIPRLKQGIALGTYPNPDHFVLLMEIAIPLTMALVAYELQHGKKRNDDGSKSMLLLITYGIMIVLFISGAFFSGSRAGIPLAILSGYLAYNVFIRKKDNKHLVLTLVIIITSIIILFSFFNLTPVINRFISNNPFVDGRWAIFSNSWDGVRTFFPLGSGPGTFPDIYRIFQPIDQALFINHAHNDYLELIFEIGLLGVIFINVFFYMYIKTWKKVKRIRVREIHYLRIATGISLFVMLLHSILEFNLHDATNILYFAALAGIFFNRIKGNVTKRHHSSTI